MEKLKVSILIPAFNSEKFISETIKSAYSQTWSNKEIIVIDDGSTDETSNILKKFKSEILTIHHQENKGASASRNKAFELSSGDYIQFLDADDILSPTKIEEQMKLINKYGNDTLITAQWETFQNNISEVKFLPRNIYKDYENPIDLIHDMCFYRISMTDSAWLCHRTLLDKAGKWDITLSAGDDWEYFSRVILSSKQIRHCELAKMYYRIDPARHSLSSFNQAAGAISWLRSIDKYIFNISEHISSTNLSKKSINEALSSQYIVFYRSCRKKFPKEAKYAKQRFKAMGDGKMYLATDGERFRKISSFIGIYNTYFLKDFVEHHFRKSKKTEN